MRESIGGVFMIRVMLVFIFLYVCFIAIALNLAKAFKMKNDIVDYLEKNQIAISGNYANDVRVQGAISDIASKYKYVVDCPKNSGSSCSNGVTIKESDSYSINGITYHCYDVEVYINRDLGFLKALLSLTSSSSNDDMSGTWAVKGKTKVIVNG